MTSNSTATENAASRDASTRLREVEAFATNCIRHHLGRDWSFAFDHAKTRAGNCNYTRRRITLSRHLVPLMTETQVVQTLLHEIAHALAGHAAGHGDGWLRVARAIGYEGGRTYEGLTPQTHRWVGRCPNGHELRRHRRPSKPVSCSSCAPRFDRRYLIVWHDAR